MKNLIFVTLFLLSMNAFAGKPKLIGQLNMISTRNIDSGIEYVLLHRGSNDSKKALKEQRAESLDGAINNAVLNIAGGEFIKNVKVYYDGKYFAVVGDVWGLASNQSIEGFNVGDIVFIKNGLLKDVTGSEKFEKVTIKGFKDRNTCLVISADGKVKEAEFSKLSKTE